MHDARCTIKDEIAAVAVLKQVQDGVQDRDEKNPVQPFILRQAPGFAKATPGKQDERVFFDK
jgi:hypothetical protein